MFGDVSNTTLISKLTMRCTTLTLSDFDPLLQNIDICFDHKFLEQTAPYVGFPARRNRCKIFPSGKIFPPGGYI